MILVMNDADPNESCFLADRCHCSPNRPFPSLAKEGSSQLMHHHQLKIDRAEVVIEIF